MKRDRQEVLQILVPGTKTCVLISLAMKSTNWYGLCVFLGFLDFSSVSRVSSFVTMAAVGLQVVRYENGGIQAHRTTLLVKNTGWSLLYAALRQHPLIAQLTSKKYLPEPGAIGVLHGSSKEQMGRGVTEHIQKNVPHEIIFRAVSVWTILFQ